MNRNITYIDDLPFLEDVENPQMSQGLGNGLSMIPTSETNNIKRFIRNNDYNLPPEAGMNTKHQQMMENEELLKQQEMYAEKQLHHQEQEQQMLNSNKKNKKKPNNTIEGYHDDLNCISVANHTANCVVCSRLYTNDSKNMLLGVIGVLIIICLILLKKIMENTK